MGKSINLIIHQLRQAGYDGEIPEGSTFMSLLKFQKEFYKKRLTDMDIEVTEEMTTAEMQKKIENTLIKPTTFSFFFHDD